MTSNYQVQLAAQRVVNKCVLQGGPTDGGSVGDVGELGKNLRIQIYKVNIQVSTVTWWL